MTRNTIHETQTRRPGGVQRLLAAALAALVLAGIFAGLSAAPAGAAVSGSFTKTGSMTTARYQHAAVRLADGRVLVTGGYESKSAEIYSPTTKTWTTVANMKDARYQHTATLLQDGRVLVVGGYGSYGLATAEVYDPGAGTWTRVGSMSYARYGHTATLLSNGKVLVVGGYGDNEQSAEVFDPNSNAFGSVSYLNYSRSRHVAARISAGRVLVAGTSDYSGSSIPRTAEVYNQQSNSWSMVGSMNVGRRYASTATALTDGRVLISGGVDSNYNYTSASEVFDPNSNTFSFTGDMNVGRAGHEAVRLSDGRVLAAGGYDGGGTAEVFNPSTNEWDLTGSQVEARSSFTMTALGSSRVLAAGGNGDAGTLDTAELFNPTTSNIQDDKITPKVAWSGSESLVVWQDGRNGNPDIYAARINSSGGLISTFPVTTAVGEQTQPTVAWNGDAFLVAWTDRRNGVDTNIYSTKVSTSGVIQSPNGKPLSLAANDQSFPIARANGTTDWFVVWQDGRSGTSTDIFGTRVNVGGNALTPAGQAISTAPRDQRRPSVAANSSGDWFVTWGDRRASNGNMDIYSTRVSSAGVVSSPNGVAVSKAAGDQSNPSAAWNGTRFLVVWADARNGNDLDIYGSLVSSTGATLNSSGIGISTRFGVSEGSPSLSAIGTQFLVGWSDTRGGTQDIYSSRVSDTGSVLSPNGVKVNSAAQDQTTPAVGMNGNSFLVVWGDTRSGTNSDIYGTRVSTSGAVQTPNGFPVAT